MKPEDTGQNLTFLAAALDSQVGRNLRRGKPLLGREQQTYCKGERHWKTGCPGIRNEKENNDRKTGASHMVEREEHSDEWRGPRSPLDLRHPVPVSPQEPWGTSTGGKVDWLSDRYGWNTLCGKHHGGTESISIHLGHDSFWTSTQLFFWQTLECQLGDLTLNHSILHMPVCPVSFGPRSPL